MESDRLTVCCWETASMPEPVLGALEDAARRRHPGAVILSTCQRLEAYRTEPCTCSDARRYTGDEALLHLASVAAGLDAVVLGEREVLGQVRTAFRDAPPAIARHASVAIAAARELRRETGAGAGTGELLDYALDHAGVPAAGRVLVLGAGATARVVAARAAALGFGEVLVAGRRASPPTWLTDERIRYLTLATCRDAGPVEVAVGCLRAPAGPDGAAVRLPRVTALLVDLGTPANFAGSEGGAPAVVRIADLQAGAGSVAREALREALRAILGRRTGMAAEDRHSPVGSLRLEIERLRLAEVDRIARLHPEIPGPTLDRITRSLLNRVFHIPSERLRELDDPEIRRLVLELFRQPAVTP